METKHTPGPWTFSDNHRGEFCINGKPISVAESKILSAAPEMFEALMNLENDDGTAMPDTAWKMVLSAIEKAGGVKRGSYNRDSNSSAGGINSEGERSGTE